MSEELGLFYGMDTSDIPDDPWFVGAGTYHAVVTKSERKVTRTGDTAFVINYSIDEPDSEFHGFNKSDYFQLFPGVDYKDLEPEQKQSIIRMKARLREAFDKTEEEIPRVVPADLVGEHVYVTITNTPGTGQHSGKTFSNIGKVQSKRLYEEQNPDGPSSGMGSVGLSGM